MINIYVDGKKYKVNKFDNLLKTYLSLGLDIPYFCWHPALGSVGACRQCAVKKYKNAEDNKGQLIMSCMTSVADGIFTSILDEESRQFRKGILEFLMINHPHDCPVCEEGGNCHLQDVAVMTGHNFRRYRFTKRTHFNQYLGPFISHEMNRCIVCYRCIRYYKDYADGNDFGVYGANDNIYFGRLKSGTLENEFSGNLIEICPTGVFTDKTNSKKYTRRWDIQFSPSICQQCSIGCNISLGERYGEIRRIENRYNGSINRYFLCDLGRFGYGYVNLKNRPKQPIQRQGNNWIKLSVYQAIQNVSSLLRHSKKIIGIGSPRASIESNFALRDLVGAENFCTGISSSEQNRLMLILNILRNGGIRTPSLHEIESYDAILILGEDVTQTGARIALAVRQAMKSKAREMASAQKISDWQISSIMNIGQYAKYPLFITNVDRTRLDDIAAWSYYAPIDNQARLGFAIAHNLDKMSPKVKNFDKSLDKKVNMVVQALINAHKPLIISGSNAGSESVITAAANIACALKRRGSNVGISFVTSCVNSMGLAMIGGNSLDDVLENINRENVDSVIVLENDLYRHASSVLINKAISKINNLIILDHKYSTLQEKANFILSAASFAESNGTLINQECRAQRFFKVYDPTYYDNQVIVLESWRWLYLIRSNYLNCQLNYTKLDHVIDAIATTLPQLKKIKYSAPDANFRIHGQKLAREPHRYSGRTAMLANIDVHEPRVLCDKDTMFNFSMEGNNSSQVLSKQVAFAWSPGWNSPQAWNKFQDEVGGHLLCGDPGIRLIEASECKLNYFNNIPPIFSTLSDNLYVVPYWHLFGSDETSQFSPVIQEKMPLPHAVISQIDAVRLGFNEDTLVKFTCNNFELFLPLRISSNLGQGQIGLPLGLPGISPILMGHKILSLRKVLL